MAFQSLTAVAAVNLATATEFNPLGDNEPKAWPKARVCEPVGDVESFQALTQRRLRCRSIGLAFRTPA